MSEAHQVVADYIFYQHEKLQVRALMTLPSKEARTLRDPRKPETVPDPSQPMPEDWDDRKTCLVPNYETGEMEMGENPGYMGEYPQPHIVNTNRFHSFLPSEKFSSDHAPLMATFSLNEDNLASTCEHPRIHEERGTIFQQQVTYVD